MRVALVVTRFPQLSETFIVSKWLGLLSLGWDAHIVCQYSSESSWAPYPGLSDRPELRSRVHLQWPTRRRLAVPALYPVALGRAAVAAPRHLARYLVRTSRLLGLRIAKRAYLDAHLIELRPALIHFEFGALALGRMSLSKALGARSIVSFRGYDLNLVGLDRPGYFADVFESADALHLLGKSLWRRAIERGCPAGAYHELIPPAIDTTFWRRQHARSAVARHRAESRLEIASVGRLDWQKGYDWSIHAVRKLVDQGVDARLTIVGDGSYVAAVGFAVRQLGLGERVTLAGAVPKADVRELLSKADVFLHGAVSEGFCNAVLEAQAMELPVVTTDAGGLLENVLDGVTGIVVPRRDPLAMVAALQRLADSPELRRRMGEAGRQRALRPEFQIANQVKRFDELYRTVLGR